MGIFDMNILINNLRNEKKISSADGIRGLAVVIVVLYHSFGNLMLNKGAYTSRTGLYGVILFFTLSSFLLSNKFIVNGFSKKELMNYCVGRVIRILPLFFIAAYFYYSIGMIDVAKLLSIITFNGTYAHLWTIPFELKFYFILPFIVFIGFLLQIKYGSLSSLFFIVLAIISSFYSPISLGGFIDNNWSPIFLMGILMCFVYNNYKLKLHPIQSDILIILSLGLMIFSTQASQYYFFGYRPQPTPMVILVWGAITSVFCYLCLESNGKISNLLNSTCMKYLGKWSFSIYLFHWAVIIISSKYKLNDVTVFVFCVIQSIGLGALIYYIIEAPLEKTRHLIMERLARSLK